MSYQIEWSLAALDDLRRLRQWAEKHQPPIAVRLADHMKCSVEKLADLPRVGRKINTPDDGPEELRELLAKPYVIRYVVSSGTIQIVRCWHYRQNRPGFDDLTIE